MEANQSLQTSLCDLTSKEDQLKVLGHPEELAAGDHVGIFEKTGIQTTKAILKKFAETVAMRAAMMPQLDASDLRDRLRMGGTPPAHGARPQLQPQPQPNPTVLQRHCSTHKTPI